MRHPLEPKAFSPSRISYLRSYFHDLLTSISVVAAMLPIMERPNVILKSEFVKISHFIGKKVKIDNNKPMAIQEHLLCCKYSSFFKDFSILISETNDFKLNKSEFFPAYSYRKSNTEVELDLSNYATKYGL